MKTVFLLLWIAMYAFAYRQGDIVDKDVAKKLAIGDDDKIYVVDFFASWCGSCRKELPLISELARRLEGSKVSVVGVDVDKEIEKGKLFQRQMKLKGALDFYVVNDPSSAIVSVFDPIGMPAIYIVKNRKIERVVFGAQDDIDKLIEKEIKELQ